MRILSVLFLFFFINFSSAAPLNNIVVFGDSLSDNGNLYKYTKNQIPTPPTYYEGRFTNGLVWVEHLVTSYFPSDSRGRLLNYAFGGASVLGADNEGIFSLKKEIDFYLSANDGKADPDSLMIVWIGSNDYLFLSEEDNAEKIVGEVTDGIKNGLETLAKAGARNILVLNLPNLGITPLARALDNEAKLNQISTTHNQQLENILINLQDSYPESKWLLFDVQNSLDHMIANMGQYGFYNVTDSCINLEVPSYTEKPTLNTTTVEKHFNKYDRLCKGFLFFDDIHPTALAHTLMSAQALEFLKSEEINFK